MSVTVLMCRWCKEPFEVARCRGRYPRACEDCRETDRVQARRAHAELEDVFCSPEGQLMLGEVAVAVRAAIEAPAGADRQEMQAAVVRLAHARGTGGLRRALLVLAGVAIRWASRVPESRWDRDPDAELVA
jgi:hypothetical protein